MHSLLCVFISQYSNKIDLGEIQMGATWDRSQNEGRGPLPPLKTATDL